MAVYAIKEFRSISAGGSCEFAINAFDLFSLFHLGQYYHIIGDFAGQMNIQRLYNADKVGDYSARVKKSQVTIIKTED